MLKKLRKNYRRLVAFMLTTVMTCTNVGTNLNVAFAAGEEENALFLLSGRELKEAARDAVDMGETFDFASLNLKAKTTTILKSYQKLLGGDGSQVYQLDLDVDDSYAPENTELQVFYNADADDFVLLFINESDMVLNFRVNVDGYETEGVRVNPNSANVEAGEEKPSYTEDYSNTTMIDDEKETAGGIVLNPTESETTGGAETDSAADDETETGDVTDETGAVDSDDPTGETGSSDAAEETGNESADDNTTEETGSESESGGAAGETESETGNGGAAGESEGETGNGGAAEETGSETGNGGAAEETGSETGNGGAAEETGSETGNGDVAEETGSETGNESGDSNAADGEELTADGNVAAISLHKIARVMTSVVILDDEVPAANMPSESESEETTTTAEAETTETDGEQEDKKETGTVTSKNNPEETLAESTEGEEETTAASPETNPEETLGTVESSTAEESKSESTDESTDGTASSGETVVDGETVTDGETVADDETIADGETVTDGETIADGETVTDGETVADGETGTPESGTTADAPIIEEEGQLLEDDLNGGIEVLGELEGKDYRTVTIWDSANAAAYRVAMEKVEEIAEAEEYEVDYNVIPYKTGTIKGPDSIIAGETLYFAVVPKDGYDIEKVTVNGQEAALAEETAVASESNLASEQYVYEVEAVEEDLYIEAEFSNAIYPKFEQSVKVNGVVITAKAKAGVIPDGTVLEAKEITTHLEEAVKEKLEETADVAKAESKDQVLAYDINLVLNGEKLENNWAESGLVEVTFSGNRIEKLAEEADRLQVFSADDNKKEELNAESAKDVTADTLKLESVTEEMKVENAGDVVFEASHFSTYVLYFTCKKRFPYKSGNIVFYQVNEAGEEIGGDDAVAVEDALKMDLGTVASNASKKSVKASDIIEALDDQWKVRSLSEYTLDGKTGYCNGTEVALQAEINGVLYPIYEIKYYTKGDSEPFEKLAIRQDYYTSEYIPLEPDEDGLYHLNLVYPDAQKVYFDVTDESGKKLVEDSKWLWLGDVKKAENGLSLGWKEITEEMIGPAPGLPTVDAMEELGINLNQPIVGPDGKFYTFERVNGDRGRIKDSAYDAYMIYCKPTADTLYFIRKNGTLYKEYSVGKKDGEYIITLIYKEQPKPHKITMRFLDREGNPIVAPIESDTNKLDLKQWYTMTGIKTEDPSQKDIADIFEGITTSKEEYVLVAVKVGDSSHRQICMNDEDTLVYCDRFTKNPSKYDGEIPADENGDYTIDFIYSDLEKSSYEKGDATQWGKQTLTELGITSDGVTVQWNETDEEIVVTIPEGYEADDINVNLTEELHKAAFYQMNSQLPGGDSNPKDDLVLDSNIQPGDPDGKRAIKVRVVNHSSKTFSYVNGSMIIEPYQYAPYDDGTGEEYSNSGAMREGYIGVSCFDGNNPWYQYGISRTQNPALHDLYGKDLLNRREFSDAVLGERLKAAGYKGIEDLNLYYLNYWNQKFGTKCNSLSEFDTEKLLGTMIGQAVESISFSIKETNPEIAALGYDCFYNALFGLTAEETIDSNNQIFNEVEKYSIGNYMRGTASFNDKCRTAWGVIKPENEVKAATDDQYVLGNLRFWVDGKRTGNPYLGYYFGVQSGFRLQHREGMAEIEVHKELAGRELQNQQFAFELYKVQADADGTETEELVAEQKNDANGAVIFADLDELHYTMERLTETDPDTGLRYGTFHYRVKEVNDAKPGYHYDDSVKNITVKAMEDEAGALNIAVEYEGEDRVFKNKYSLANGSIVIPGKKIVMDSGTEKKPAADQFTFGLYDMNGKLVSKAGNDAEGNFQLTAPEYTSSHVNQEFSYQVKEIKGTDKNYTYDDKVYHVNIKVEDAGNGTLKIRAAYPDGPVIFTNIYTKPTEPTKPGGGSSGGGGGDGDDPKTPINPTPVPLANVPEVPELVVLPDEEVPLAALPKTGRTSANGLVLLLSSVMLAAFAAAGRKKEDEQ